MSGKGASTSTTEPTVRELFNLTGRVALVTGASGHLGGAIARGLAEAGATVVVSSRDSARAADVAVSLPSGGSQRHVGVRLDHLDEASITAGIEDAVSRVGGIDILVNNAHDVLGADWSTVTGEQFDQQLRNATGYFLLARAVRNHAVHRGQPANVIMLSSMYGLVASYPQVYESITASSPVAYHALKGGILQMTRHLAVYWAKDRVRVNAISPGPFPRANNGGLSDRLKERVPLGRIGEPHELKGAAVFLASDASSFVTGQNLVVDGGWTAW
jgi:NAD(P)-dependent dehydrogenase (short-subunit alcohol dehydrogenase family)